MSNKKEDQTKATSTSYALKAVRTHLITIWERGLLDESEYQKANAVIEKAIRNYFEQEFGGMS